MPYAGTSSSRGSSGSASGSGSAGSWSCSCSSSLFTRYFHEVLGGSRTTAYLVTVAIVLSFFVSMILHELGHALVARRNGVPVMGIDLWALGGITRTGPDAARPGRSCGSPPPGRW